MPSTEAVHLLIPVKAFSRAKARLAPALEPTERADLARTMATRVVEALGDRAIWIVCDDSAVAQWAHSLDVPIVWQPGQGLNGAVTAAAAERFADGAARVTVVHSDLPLLTTLPETAPQETTIVVVPDRHEQGTNVLSTSTPEFRFSYGVGSFCRHLAEAERLGLAARVVRDGALGWDVDEPADLSVFSPAAFSQRND